MRERTSTLQKAGGYLGEKVANLREAPYHVQRTAVTVAAAAATVAIVGLAVLLQATIGGSTAQPAAPAAAGPSLGDAIDQVRSQAAEAWPTFSAGIPTTTDPETDPETDPQADSQTY